MSDVLEQYRKAHAPLPAENLRWEMYGAGLENFGKNGMPIHQAVPSPGPDELLLRTDAVGICFSDVKLTSLGPEHPRITGRDLVKDPVVPGHEVSATVVEVGANLRERFKVGERYIVQADVFYKGTSMAYGYVLPGAMQQYGLVGPEVLQGDDGCYLLPIKEETGYLQAALAEPWACVVAAYRIQPRTHMKKGGTAWFYATGNAQTEQIALGDTLVDDTLPAKILTTNVSASLSEKIQAASKPTSTALIQRDQVRAEEFATVSDETTGGVGFDDIVVLGAPTTDEARELAKVLAPGGVMNIVAGKGIGGDVEIDIGRVHYDRLTFAGTSSPDVSAGYRMPRTTELKRGGATWFIGAAGPMGQMHVQRAVELDSPPAKILCTDIDDERIEMLRLRVDNIAKQRGIEMRFVNPTKLQPGEQERIISEMTDDRGFDDVVSLVPVAALIAQAAQHIASEGVFNIFAGVPRGTKAILPISDCYVRNIRYVGSSGSRLSDLEDTLRLSEAGQLGTAASAAAIGGMNAMREGIAAVKEGRFPGKTVIFPQFPDFPLTPITDLKDKLPTVYQKLRDGLFWTKEAEEEFFRVMLSAGSLEGEKSRPKPKRLLGKVALVTGAAQGLGQALAARLAREGASVVVVDLNLDGAKATAEEIGTESSVETMAVGLDITREEDVAASISQVVARFGRLDILVANAGILFAGAIEDFDVARWRKVIEVNLVGYMITAKQAAIQMIAQKSGTIIQINSKSGKKGSFRNSAYAASKFGGIGLTQSLALELAPHGIRVHAVCPGNLLDSPLWVDSLYEQYAKTQGISKEEVRKKYEGQVPLGRGCSYDDVANVVVFLASEEAGYMTGQAINVTGGQQMD
ncbi:MAG: sorbitol-6-phosphate dehydrogenase [Armatimonadetes bacterium]|nr:sorbitol-6-phosphate dehydrogenase [Armatimonadota bacterium]